MGPISWFKPFSTGENDFHSDFTVRVCVHLDM